MHLKERYGPEVKYKHGLTELLEALASYQEPEGVTTNPLKYFHELLSSGDCSILEVGSGWEKEAVEAVADYGPGINWVSLNPMLADSDHNQKVTEHIDEHIWNSQIKRALQNIGINEPPRRAVAAESGALPFGDNSFDLALASWSVPTVMEERLAGMKGIQDSEQRVLAEHSLATLIDDTCREYSRVVRPDGAVMTFPIRDPRLVDAFVQSLDSYGSWQHIICKTQDNTYYAKDFDGVNFLLFSIRLNE